MLNVSDDPYYHLRVLAFSARKNGQKSKTKIEIPKIPFKLSNLAEKPTFSFALKRRFVLKNFP